MYFASRGLPQIGQGFAAGLATGPAAGDIGGDAGLLLGQTLGQGARRFVAARRLVDVGGNDRIRLDADLGKQRQPARRGGGENETGPCGQVAQSGRPMAIGVPNPAI